MFGLMKGWAFFRDSNVMVCLRKSASRVNY